MRKPHSRCPQAAQWELQSEKTRREREAEALAAAKRAAEEEVECLRAENAALHEQSQVESCTQRSHLAQGLLLDPCHVCTG